MQWLHDLALGSAVPMGRRTANRETSARSAHTRERDYERGFASVESIWFARNQVIASSIAFSIGPYV